MAEQTIHIPDIGGAADVTVIDVMVSPGDSIAQDDPLITLEGDKATMDIPAETAGVVKTLLVAKGDKVSEGSPLLVLMLAASAEADLGDKPAAAEASEGVSESSGGSDASSSTVSEPVTSVFHLPDLGTDDAVRVIDLAVSVGDVVAEESPLLTLEGDKATMDIPAPYAAEVVSFSVAVGDSVKTGTAVMTLKGAAQTEASSTAAPAAQSSVQPSVSDSPAPSAPAPTTAPAVAAPLPAVAPNASVYAGPSARRFAYRLGVDLRYVTATGHKGRVTVEDVEGYVRARLQQPASAASSGSGLGFDLPEMPKVDFSRFGPTKTVPLSRIKRLSGGFLHRNWVHIPHITQFERFDMTDLEAYRKKHKQVLLDRGIRMTPLVFIMKAVVSALQAFPEMNASLASDGAHLIQKDYYHIGVAVDTPTGLVVAVIRDADKKNILELAQELADISKKARETGLSMKEMQGSTFTLSSLGGVGGEYFTPIVNAPDLGILGISKARIMPEYDAQSGSWLPRLMLPLSLSYDHRVIDGVCGAHFLMHIGKQLTHFDDMMLTSLLS